LRLYWHGAHFEPVFPTAGDRAAVLGRLGEGPPAVAAAWQAARELRLDLAQVRVLLARLRQLGTLDDATVEDIRDQAEGIAEGIESTGGRIAVNVTAQTSDEAISPLCDQVRRLGDLLGGLRQLLGEPGRPPAAGTGASTAPSSARDQAEADPGRRPESQPSELGRTAGSRQAVRQFVDQRLDALGDMAPDEAVAALEAVLDEAAGDRGESQFRALRNVLVGRGLQLLRPAEVDTAHTRELPGIDAGQLPAVFTVADAVTGRAGPEYGTAAGPLFVVRQPKARDLSVVPGQEPGTVMFAPGTRFEVVADSVMNGRRIVELRHPRAASDSDTESGGIPSGPGSPADPGTPVVPSTGLPADDAE